MRTTIVANCGRWHSRHLSCKNAPTRDPHVQQQLLGHEPLRRVPSPVAFGDLHEDLDEQSAVQFEHLLLELFRIARSLGRVTNRFGSGDAVERFAFTQLMP